MSVTTVFGIIFLLLSITSLIFAIVTFTVKTLPQRWSDNKTIIGVSLSIGCGILLILAAVLFFSGGRQADVYSEY